MTSPFTPEENDLQSYQAWLHNQTAEPRSTTLKATATELRNWSDALADVQCWFMGFRAATKVLEQEISTPEAIGALQSLRELKKRLDGLTSEPRT